jgi:hypothetical protein
MYTGMLNNLYRYVLAYIGKLDFQVMPLYSFIIIKPDATAS